MATRRAVLQSGTAATVLSLGLPVTTLAENGFARQKTLPFFRVLYEQNIKESCDFAAASRAAGLDISGLVQGDVTSFWMHELSEVWPHKEASLMGLTTPGPLFCLEQLAPQFGMRVIFRAKHQADNPLCLDMQGPDNLLEKFKSDTVIRDWSVHLAGLMGACPEGLVRMTENRVFSKQPVFHSTRLLEHKTLVAWIIAPAMQFRQEA